MTSADHPGRSLPFRHSGRAGDWPKACAKNSWRRQPVRC